MGIGALVGPSLVVAIKVEEETKEALQPDPAAEIREAVEETKVATLAATIKVVVVATKVETLAAATKVVAAGETKAAAQHVPVAAQHVPVAAQHVPVAAQHGPVPVAQMLLWEDDRQMVEEELDRNPEAAAVGTGRCFVIRTVPRNRVQPSAKRFGSDYAVFVQTANHKKLLNT